MCLMECPNGFSVDSNGCRQCSCLEPDQSIPVPTNQECPPIVCQTMACPDGFAVDSDGCPTCECLSRSSSTSSGTRRLLCGMAAETGECRGWKEYFYFNETTGRCEKFVYGGCGGTANRFLTEDHCNTYCQSGVCSATMCLMECPNGFAVDTNGCQMCACLEPDQSISSPACPLRKCRAIACPNGFALDSNGCQTCECAESGSQSKLSARCPSSELAICTMYCEHGFKKDDQGCQICQCNEAPTCSENLATSCLIYCEHGFKNDERGCPMCQCNEQAPCQDLTSTCRMYCEHGFAVDARGCPTCKCQPAPVCPINGTCRMFCKYSAKSSSCNVCKCRMPPLLTSTCPRLELPDCAVDGCPHERRERVLRDDCDRCECQNDPCREIECEPEEKCVVDLNHRSFTPKCVAGRRWCSDVMCRMYCEKGYQTDKYGCQICQCREEPKSAVCPRSRIHKIQNCEFGPAYDDDGCRTETCLPNPCHEETNRCSDGFVCEAFRIKNCVYCPAIPRCIDARHVQRTKVTLEYIHNSGRVKDVEFVQAAEKLFTEEIEGNTQCDMVELSAQLSSGRVVVSFQIVPILTKWIMCDPTQIAKRIVEKVQKKELRIYLNGVSFTPGDMPVQVTYYSDDFVPQTANNADNYSQGPVIAAAVISAFVGAAVIVVVVALLCRRRKKSADYKKTPQRDLSPSLM